MARYYWDKKNTTDDYSQVWSIFHLKRDKVLKNGEYTFSGTSNWSRNGEPSGSISFELTKDNYNGKVRVHFTQTSSRTGEKKAHDYIIQLESTPCHLWGRRWWFVCPCWWGRCAKLYMQNNGIFASRKILWLSYETRNTSRRWRYLDYVFWASDSDMSKLYQSIKYPYRNWKPTRKMKRYLKMTYSPYTLEEMHRLQVQLLRGK